MSALVAHSEETARLNHEVDETIERLSRDRSWVVDIATVSAETLNRVENRLDNIENCNPGMERIILTKRHQKEVYEKRIARLLQDQEGKDKSHMTVIAKFQQQLQTATDRRNMSSREHMAAVKQVERLVLESKRLQDRTQSLERELQDEKAKHVASLEAAQNKHTKQLLEHVSQSQNTAAQLAALQQEHAELLDAYGMEAKTVEGVAKRSSAQSKILKMQRAHEKELVTQKRQHKAQVAGHKAELEQHKAHITEHQEASERHKAKIAEHQAALDAQKQATADKMSQMAEQVEWAAEKEAELALADKLAADWQAEQLRQTHVAELLRRKQENEELKRSFELQTQQHQAQLLEVGSSGDDANQASAMQQAEIEALAAERARLQTELAAAREAQDTAAAATHATHAELARAHSEKEEADAAAQRYVQDHENAVAAADKYRTEHRDLLMEHR